MAKAKNEIAKKDETGGAVTVWEDAGGTGFEETSGDDYALPFLKLLQKSSPEVDEDDGAFIEGAKPGMFLDSATGELFETVDVIPCVYKHAIVEWAGDDPGSGFVGQHDVGYETKFPRHEKNGRTTGKWVTPEGHILEDTRYFFCLRMDASGDTLPCVVSMKSTQIKKSKAWMSRMQALRMDGPGGARVQAPMFSNVWRLSSVGEENDFGSFKGYKVDRVRAIDPAGDVELIQQVKDAVTMFRASSANVKPPVDAAGSGKKDGDEIPF